MRVSYEEAAKRGWIDPKDVPAELRVPPARGGARRGNKSTTRRAAEDDAPGPRLWYALKDIPGAHQEFGGAIPGRAFRLDVAFPDQRLCIEIDGWEHHGKFKADFQRDRERQNLLCLAGWRILRFTAKDIRGDIKLCVKQVKMALGLEPLDLCAKRTPPKEM